MKQPHLASTDVDTYIAETTATAVEALKQKRDELQQQVERIEEVLTTLRGTNGSPRPAAVAPKAEPNTHGRRKRRGTEELKADAQKLVAYLKKHPGSKAADLKEVADYGLSLKNFLKTYADVKVTTEGAKASMRYSVA